MQPAESAANAGDCIGPSESSRHRQRRLFHAPHARSRDLQKNMNP